jgi:hypothetical protein
MMVYPVTILKLRGVASVAVEIKYPVLISLGAKLVLYVISTSLAGTFAITLLFKPVLITFIVVSVLFTIPISR